MYMANDPETPDMIEGDDEMRKKLEQTLGSDNGDEPESDPFDKDGLGNVPAEEDDSGSVD
jgi:hypothetical protein